MGKHILAAVAYTLLTTSAIARELAGVTVPDTVTLGDQHALVLNGAGIRSKFFVKVYVGALYLPTRTNDADAVLRHTGPVAMHMHMLHSEVSKEKLVKGWNEGFDANLNDAERTVLGPRIETFNNMFTTARKGDVIRLDYQPGRGTAVTINNEPRGTIEGEDFMHAWLRIWLGKHPADSGLKKGLLGTN